MTESWKSRMNSAGTVVCAPDWSWDTAPGLSDYDLITIWKGAGRYHIGETVYPARPGACLLLRKGQRVIGAMDPSRPMTVTYIHFDYLDHRNRPKTPEGSQLPELYRIIDRPLFFQELLTQAMAAFFDQRDRAASECWMAAILHYLLSRDSQSRWLGFEREQAEAFKSLGTRIAQNPETPWCIADLAKEFHYTPDHFGRLFVKYIGRPPGEYIIRSRINAAVSLLHSSSHSIGRIAELLGYSDIYAFSHQFRKCTGVTPSAYRRRL